MRTTTKTVEVKCDGCPAAVTIDCTTNRPNQPEGWARVSFETFPDELRTEGRTVDLCPRCVATLPWRRS